MTAFTDSLGFDKGTKAYTSTYTNRFTVIEIDLDFAAIAAARVGVFAFLGGLNASVSESVHSCANKCT